MSSYLSTKSRMKRLDITDDDSKVLGKSPTRFTHKSADHFTTKKYMTHNSAWTPINHKPSNEQIYKERRELISHWFDLWTDSQRKRFLDVILKKCAKSQLIFAHTWFEENKVCAMCPTEDLIIALQAKAVLTRIDITTILPRFLSIYIFSMLDAKSLSRCSQVSWTWKFIAEQDCLWRPKCEKFGWYLPYRPASTEYGAWKSHYIHCVLNMDVVLHSHWPTNPNIHDCDVDAMYKHLTDAQKMAALYERMEIVGGGRGRTKPLPIDKHAAREILDSRPPWYGSSHTTQDLSQANKALLYGLNPNDPAMSGQSLKHHNKFGQLNTRSRSRTSPNADFGLNSKTRRGTHRSVSNSMAGAVGGAMEVSLDGSDTKMQLSEVTLHKYQKSLEKTINELKSRPWEPVSSHTRRGVTSTDDYCYTTSTNQRRVKVESPRIIFISSRVPAAEVLHDAVLNEVYPLQYEFEGTTVENLVDRLGKTLDGRIASSIGIVVHSTQPGELCLTGDTVITLDELDSDKVTWFFQSLANFTKASKDGGVIDVFSPLAASEPGTEMLIQLNILTGHKFTAPTGVSGQWNQWYCDWYGATQSPAGNYFEKSKTLLWSTMAEVVTDAISHTKRELQPYFDQTKTQVMNQVTGQIVTDAMSLGNVQGMSRVIPHVTECLALLGNQQNVNPIEFVTNYFMSISGNDSLSQTGSPDQQHTLTKSMQDMEDEKRDIEKDTDTATHQSTLLNDSQSDTFLTTGRNVSFNKSASSHKQYPNLSASRDLMTMRRRKGLFSSTLATLPQSEYADHPDRRFVISKEMLSTETAYNQELDILKRIFVLPLKRSIESNRAVTASSTLQQIFSDIMILHDINKTFLADLSLRVRDWTASQCVGEVFVKFGVKLSAYMNYISKYPTILLTLDREIEVNPGFRAFLKRQENTPATKMKGIQEFLLSPILRIGVYVRLLSWMKANTPHDNPDREDITSALNQFKQVDTVIRQTRSRIQRDRKLVSVSRMIEGCPHLLEANRVFIMRQEFSLMVASQRNAASLPHDSRVYTHIENLCFFLFNDALVFTHILTGHHAFERSVTRTYLFKSSVSLVGLRVKDLPDTRYMRNAFRLTYDTEEWILACETHDLKFEFLNSLEAHIKTAIQDDSYDQ